VRAEPQHKNLKKHTTVRVASAASFPMLVERNLKHIPAEKMSDRLLAGHKYIQDNYLAAQISSLDSNSPYALPHGPKLYPGSLLLASFAEIGVIVRNSQSHIVRADCWCLLAKVIFCSYVVCVMAGLWCLSVAGGAEVELPPYTIEDQGASCAAVHLGGD